jgi:multiple sugar transport system permease protein
MHIYENGFRFLRMGYASAIAMLLFAIILVITIIQMTLSKRWVFYQ